MIAIIDYGAGNLLHPEKSGESGLKRYNNFIKLVPAARVSGKRLRVGTQWQRTQPK